MQRLSGIILAALAFVLPSMAQPVEGEPSVIVIEDSTDFIISSLMVAEPSAEHVQSVFGHAFLRMQSPQNDLDLCFSMESGDYQGFLDICLGRYPNRLVVVPTSKYIEGFISEGRAVEGYDLNLTLEEGQRLWQLLDETSVKGNSVHEDYFHHGCSHEIVRLINQSLTGTIVFGDKAKAYDSTLFTLGARLLPSNSWMRILASLLIATTDTDHELSDFDKATFPTILHDLFADATIVEPDGRSRSFFKAHEPHAFVPDKLVSAGTSWPVSLWLSLALIVVTGCCCLSCLLRSTGRGSKADRAFTAFVFVLYNVLSGALLVICLLSSLPSIHGWNWNLLVYNLVPLFVWLYDRRHPFSPRQWCYIYAAYAVWICCFDALMLLWGGHQILEQYLLSSLFLVFCLSRSISLQHKS